LPRKKSTRLSYPDPHLEFSYSPTRLFVIREIQLLHYSIPFHLLSFAMGVSAVMLTNENGFDIVHKLRQLNITINLMQSTALLRRTPCTSVKTNRQTYVNFQTDD